MSIKKTIATTLRYLFLALFLGLLAAILCAAQLLRQ